MRRDVMTDKKEIIKNCPFKDFLNEWDEDYDDIITLVCEDCAARDECSEDMMDDLIIEEA
jgi:hypothetical protein